MPLCAVPVHSGRWGSGGGDRVQETERRRPTPDRRNEPLLERDQKKVAQHPVRDHFIAVLTVTVWRGRTFLEPRLFFCLNKWHSFTFMELLFFRATIALNCWLHFFSGRLRVEKYFFYAFVGEQIFFFPQSLDIKSAQHHSGCSVLSFRFSHKSIFWNAFCYTETYWCH